MSDDHDGDAEDGAEALTGPLLDRLAKLSNHIDEFADEYEDLQRHVHALQRSPSDRLKRQTTEELRSLEQRLHQIVYQSEGIEANLAGYGLSRYRATKAAHGDEPAEAPDDLSFTPASEIDADGGDDS